VMRIATPLLAAILTQVAAVVDAAPAAPLHWVQLGPGGAAELRAMTEAAECPTAMIDGVSYNLTQRAAPDANFARVCAMTLPVGARMATLEGAAVPLPKAAPERILVIGDTGCRIEGNFTQACNDPDKWPFARIASEAAGLKPDLTIHVGDYDYRESPCPAGNSGCAGSAWGNNGPSWEADFFTPAAPLLAAAPFVFVRGNHEECARFGAGWLRLLGPLPLLPGAPCTDHIAPYAIPLPGMTLAVMDDATAPDTAAPRDLVQLYRGDFSALKAITPGPVWLTTHRPLSGYVLVPPFIPAGGNQTLLAAMREDGFPENIELMISGHIHAFEAINYLGNVAPQLIAGNSGDSLSNVPANLAGINLGGLPVVSGLTLPGFGYLLLTRTDAGWNIDVYDVHGAKQRSCLFAARKIGC
jgi:Calcineurin-like phosphoesterase